MELETQCSVAHKNNDNEVVTPVFSESTIIGTIGACHETDSEGGSVKSPSSSAAVHSPGGSMGLSPPTVTKGVGLKKWRRIRREGGNEVGSNLDSGKPLKRGLSNSVGNGNMRPVNVSGEVKQKSEGSVSSTNAVVKVFGNGPDDVTIYGSDSGSVGRPVFAHEMDSENSEERSSKSSTAASALRSGYEIPAVVRYGGDKMRNLGGKNLGNSVSAQKSVQQGKGRVEGSKKARGERIKIEKENSHSSMESDSRSSNFVFMQGPHSVSSNGRRSGKLNYDGESCDDVQDGEQHINEDVRTGFSINEAESEDGSQEDLAADLSPGMKEDKSENHGSSTDQDVLIESINALQSAEEALEKEVENMRNMGKDNTLLVDDSIQAEDLQLELDTVTPEEHDPSSSDQEVLEKQMISLTESVINLEAKLMEARIMYDMKEAKVVQLEAILNTTSKSPKEERGTSDNTDIEAELEGIYRQKIEAQIEYLAISKAIQTLRVDMVDQIKLIEEQKALASKQVEVVNKLEDAEKKAITLKKQADKLESSCEEIVEGDEVLKLQNRLSKFTWFFLIQLLLLVLVFGQFVSQLSPYLGYFVPT